MRQSDPRLPEKMTGGIRNPLGVKALYLGNTLYRIHGTNDAKTIGYAASSGCFRMLNGHVVDLAARVQIGDEVIVVDRLPREIAVGEPARRAEARVRRGYYEAERRPSRLRLPDDDDDLPPPGYGRYRYGY